MQCAGDLAGEYTLLATLSSTQHMYSCVYTWVLYSQALSLLYSRIAFTEYQKFLLEFCLARMGNQIRVAYIFLACKYRNVSNVQGYT